MYVCMRVCVCVCESAQRILVGSKKIENLALGGVECTDSCRATDKRGSKKKDKPDGYHDLRPC